MDNLPDDEELYDDYFDEPRPFWTRRRILLLIFAIVILVTMFVYLFSGLFTTPTPPPTLVPGSLI